MTRPFIDAVVFDMDGVLFDTEPLHRRAWQATAAEAGAEMTDAFLLDWVGVPCIDLARWCEERWTPRRPAVEYLEAKRKRFHAICTAELVPFPGLVDALDRFDALGVGVGMATSSERIDADLLLSVTGLAPRMAATVTHDDVTRHKPDPESYRTAAERLGVAPERCVALDDSPTGVPSAKAAGMLVLGVASTFPPDALSEADRVFPSTAEACRWVLSGLDIDT